MFAGSFLASKKTQEICRISCCSLVRYSRDRMFGHLAPPAPRGVVAQERTRLWLPSACSFPLFVVTHKVRSHRVSLWVSTFFLSVAGHPMPLGQYNFPFFTLLIACCPVCSFFSSLWLPHPRGAHGPGGSGDSRVTRERGNIPLSHTAALASVYFSAPAVLSALSRGGGGGGERRPPAPLASRQSQSCCRRRRRCCSWL